MKILRDKQLRQKIGISKMQLWRLEREGKFPKRIQLGPNSVGWIEEEVDSWIKARMDDRLLTGRE